MSTITAPGPDGDAELAHLLASAASCGWHGADDTTGSIARRCRWPAWLCAAVRQLPDRQRADLVRASRALWDVFAAPCEHLRTLREMIGSPRMELRLDDGPRLVVVPESASHALIVAAALGLAHVLTTQGAEALGTCESQSCTQPVLRLGRRSRSRACSPDCANRVRVARHRARQRTGDR